MLVQQNCFESHFAAEGLFESVEGLDPFFASSQQPPLSQFHLFYLVSALPYVALEETRLHSEEELLTLISNRQLIWPEGLHFNVVGRKTERFAFSLVILTQSASAVRPASAR